MRFFRYLLLVLMLATQPVVAAAAAHSCCAEIDCPAVECAAMGCLASLPPAALTQGHSWLLELARSAPPVAPAVRLPLLSKAIWTPPD